MSYPSARRSSVVNDFVSGRYGGVKVPNPYHWLEDSATDDSQTFIREQNTRFQEYISDPKLASSRKLLESTLSKLHGLPTLLGAPQAAGDYFYYRVAGQGSMFPTTYRIPKTTLIHWMQGTLDVLKQSEIFHEEAEDRGAAVSSGFSKGGNSWAYSSSIAGSAWCTIRVKDTDTKQLLSDFLVDVKFSAREDVVSWLGNFGFFYQFWTDRENSRGPQLRFHQLGMRQQDDVVVFEDRMGEGLTFAAEVSTNSDFLLLSIFKAGRKHKLWIAQIRDDNLVSRGPKDFYFPFNIKISDEFEAEWRYLGTVGSSLIFHTTAENGKVVKLSTLTSRVENVVGGKAEKTLKLARMLPYGNILAVYSIDVHDELYLFSLLGELVAKIDSPILTILDISVDLRTSDFFVLESTFYSPPKLWHGHYNGISTHLAQLPMFQDASTETTPFTTRQIFYPSKDRTKIPMFITSSGKIAPETPILFYIYGGLGISVIPHFRADFVTFLQAFCGVLVIANVRGGGEYGMKWYAAACKGLRQNLFDDVISGVEYFRNKFGSKSIALMGESMGGLNASAVMIQQPALLQGVFLNVAVIDILRRSRLSHDARGKDDVGDPEVPKELDGMLAYSPLENMITGTKYPPTLLFAGDKDDTVPAMHSCKMAASLQFASVGVEGSGNVSLQIMKDAGHGVNNSAEQKKKASLQKWLWAIKALGWKIVEP